MVKEITLWFDELSTTPLGPLCVAASRTGVRRIIFGKPRDLTFKEAPGSPPQFLFQATDQLHAYLTGQREQFVLPLDFYGLTEFQVRVLTACQAIPYGQVRPYSDLAHMVGSPVTASRAIGMVMANNPLPIVIPCHRVVGRDGKLHGYGGAGGVETKAWLLRLEGSRLVG